MEKSDLRIVYMGTPDFAVEPLKRLVEHGFNIVAVVTMPDKPAGRGHKIQFSPVKKYALEQNLPVLQPEKLKDEAWLETLRSYRADLQIVVAFRMLPEVVWNMPAMGTFNLHASLLPEYRGAAPINWAVINGEKRTGVTTFFLQHEIDTGDIIMQKAIDLSDDDNAGTVHDRLMELGGCMVVETVEKILANDVKLSRQPEAVLKPAPKIFKETCELHFDREVESVHNLVRGLSPYPGAWLTCGNGEVVKVFKTHIERSGDTVEGKMESDGKKFVRVGCNGGWLYLDEVQMAGKRRMPIDEMLRGIHDIGSLFVLV
ncbi:MAG: methionyl-tRNA formyltransferase [Paludibacteraceae bacterium]|nr:methionyl-tRNA formyltransferase [Paludibacteraceae bacterium]